MDERTEIDEFGADLVRFEQSLVPCVRCDGRGYRLVMYGWLGIWERESCRACKGSGKVLPKARLAAIDKALAWIKTWRVKVLEDLGKPVELETTRSLAVSNVLDVLDEGTYREPPKSEVELLREEVAALRREHARLDSAVRWALGVVIGLTILQALHLLVG